MGDCRVRIHVCASLIENRPITVDHTSTDRLVVISNTLWSADSTVFEVLCQTVITQQTEDTLTKNSSEHPKGTIDASYQTLQSLIKERSAVVWDCTKLPAADVTNLCSVDVAQNTTLFAAGWFPSGHLQVLPESSNSPRGAKVDAYDDDTRTYHAQCSETATTDAQNTSKVLVQLSHAGVASGSRAQPSQVLYEVTQRFGDTSHDSEEQAQARLHRHLNAQLKTEAEALRRRKLDDRINRLVATSGGKNKVVSDQVRRMLVRSRATGRPDLLEQDRIYLHCLLERPADQNATTVCMDPTEMYRFFSLQDTVGRALATFPETKMPLGEKVEVEMLVHFTLENGTPDVRRLPSTLRFYEAVGHSYLTGTLDTVVIRCFNSDRDECTPLIATRVVQEIPVKSGNADVATNSKMVTIQAAVQRSSKVVVYTSHTNPTLEQTQRHAHMTEALQALKQSKTFKTKKPNGASEKVRQMQIKSKATGDTKRIKLQDRFFLEIVTIIDKSHDTSIDSTTTSPCTVLSVAPVFVACSDKLDRCVHDVLKWPTPETKNGTHDSIWSWELLCTTSKEQYPDDSDATGAMECLVGYNEGTSTRTWNEVVQDATISQFDRVILRYFVDIV